MIPGQDFIDDQSLMPPEVVEELKRRVAKTEELTGYIEPLAKRIETIRGEKGRHMSFAEDMPYLNLEFRHLGKKFAAHLMAHDSEINKAVGRVFDDLSSDGTLERLMRDAMAKHIHKAVANAMRTDEFADAVRALMVKRIEK